MARSPKNANSLNASALGAGPPKASPPKPGPRKAPKAGPAPTQARLHEAALRHLARFATTEAGLVRVLDRRVQRWARLAEAEGQGPETAPLRVFVREVARALVQAGVIDDAAFAAARSTRLARAGRSRQATAAHLAAKGIDGTVAGAALPPAEAELPASLIYARKRRIGPFRPQTAPDPDAEADPKPDTRQRDLAALARAGFPREIAEQALAMTPDDALALILRLKRA